MLLGLKSSAAIVANMMPDQIQKKKTRKVVKGGEGILRVVTKYSQQHVGYDSSSIAQSREVGKSFPLSLSKARPP